MKTLIHARYDGKVLIPEEPLELREGQRVAVFLLELPLQAGGLSKEQKKDVLRRIVERGAKGIDLPDEALRRETIYEDRV